MSKLRLDDNLVRIILLTVLLFILYYFILLPVGFLQPLRLNLNDTIFDIFRYIKKQPPPVHEIVTIEIDEQTLITIAKKWPWDRIFFADIIEKIAGYNPRAIGIDITFFGESTNLEEDARLADAIKKAGNVILPSFITEEGDYIIPHSLFISSAFGYGFVNKITDPDYKIRKARLIYQKPSVRKSYFSFELHLASIYLGIPIENLINKLGIPVDKSGSIYINYPPIQDVRTISLLDLMQNRLEDENLFKDKIVMLGHTSKTLHDIHQTPKGLMPGVFINAYTLNTILTQSFINDIPNTIILPIIFLLLLLTAVFTYRLSLPKGSIFLGTETLLIILGFLTATYYNWRLDYFSSVLVIALSYVASNSYKYGYLLYSGNRLKRMVITDSVTGLATPRYFQFKLQLDMSRAADIKTGVSIVIFTIPEFQELLKKYSREQLELILRQFSFILKQNSRKKADLLSRWKEDKFAAILLKTDIDEARSYSQKIISKTQENEFLLPDGVMPLNIYAGISNYPTTKTTSAQAIISCAEAASNRAGTTPQRICVFNPQQDKIHVEILQGESIAKEEDYISVDIAEREKELITALNELKKSQAEIQKAHFDTILSLVKALEEKDTYTAGHSERVSNYAVGIARKMGLDEAEVTLIEQSSFLHDIGKVGLPDKILHKKEALTEDEVNEIKKHPVNGARILERSIFFKNHIPLILHHQERYDGKGYPHGLSGKFIPRGAQIIAIADAIDAMTSGRGYNRILSVEEVVQELEKSSGTHFDPDYIKSAIDFLQGTK